MIVHDLKTLAKYWDDVYAGVKTFELREDDRPGGFQVGDLLNLTRVDVDFHGFVNPAPRTLPNRQNKSTQIVSQLVQVTYKLTGADITNIAGIGVPVLAKGWCVLGIRKL